MEPAKDPECPCDQQLERLFAYLDENLDPRVKAMIEQHLESCPRCRSFVTDLKRMFQICRQDWQASKADLEVIDRVKQQLRAKCRKC